MSVHTNDNLKSYFEFEAKEIKPLVKKRQYKQAIQILEQKWNEKDNSEIRGFVQTSLHGPLIATKQYQKLLWWSQKMVELYPTSSHSLDRLASCHFHALHRPKHLPLFEDIEDAFSCWEKALQVEKKSKNFYFIACNYLRALSKLKKWNIMENIIARLPEHLTPNVTSMDDVMPIENDWLTNCPDDVISPDILDEYYAACKVYINSKQLFLEKEDLL